TSPASNWSTRTNDPFVLYSTPRRTVDKKNSASNWSKRTKIFRSKLTRRAGQFDRLQQSTEKVSQRSTEDMLKLCRQIKLLLQATGAR
ncbi:MAG: hypothetical protein ACREBR_00015, partial [bacterium]